MRILAVGVAGAGLSAVGFVAWAWSGLPAGSPVGRGLTMAAVGLLLAGVCVWLCARVACALWKTESAQTLSEALFGGWMLIVFGGLQWAPGREWSETLASWLGRGLSSETDALASCFLWFGSIAYVCLMVFLYNRFIVLKTSSGSE